MRMFRGVRSVARYIHEIGRWNLTGESKFSPYRNGSSVKSWSNSHFHISLYYIKQVSDTAKVLITEGLEKVSVNRVAMFTIEADTSLGIPTVEVLSPTRESLPVQLKPVGSSSYNAGFTPTDVGQLIHRKMVKGDVESAFYITY